MVAPQGALQTRLQRALNSETHCRANLIDSFAMAQRTILRFVLPVVLGLVVGFLALALAIANEPTTPVGILTLYSPGLKVAEMILPQEHGSLAWTFGWFLRIAIGVN